MWWRSLRLQHRVIRALIVRESYARFGRDNLGFGWVIGEPLIFALPVLFMWHMIRPRVEHGVPMLAMTWSGYLPLLMFRHMGSRCLLFARMNWALLYHRQVTIFDLFAARALLEILSNLCALLVSWVVLYLLGAIDVPQNFALFYVGYFYMAWFSVAISLIVGALSERSDLVEKIWPPVSYIYMPISGFFYLAEWLPDRIREWALLVVPPLHSYEMIRSGLLGPIFRAHYDIAYVSAILTVMTVIGLKLLHDTYQYLVVE